MRGKPHRGCGELLGIGRLDADGTSSRRFSGQHLARSSPEPHRECDPTLGPFPLRARGKVRWFITPAYGREQKRTQVCATLVPLERTQHSRPFCSRVLVRSKIHQSQRSRKESQPSSSAVPRGASYGPVPSRGISATLRLAGCIPRSLSTLNRVVHVTAVSGLELAAAS